MNHKPLPFDGTGRKRYNRILTVCRNGGLPVPLLYHLLHKRIERLPILKTYLIHTVFVLHFIPRKNFIPEDCIRQINRKILILL